MARAKERERRRRREELARLRRAHEETFDRLRQLSHPEMTAWLKRIQVIEPPEAPADKDKRD